MRALSIGSVAVGFLALAAVSCGPQPGPNEFSASRDKVEQGSISTDAASYGGNPTVGVTFSGFPGSTVQYLTLASAGSPRSSFVRSVDIATLTQGTSSFPAVTEGRYVVRAYADNAQGFLAESAPFTVASALGSLSVSSAETAYASGAEVAISFTASSAPQNWVAVAPEGARNESYLVWAYTGADANGTRRFSGLRDGRYVARLFANNYPDLLAESAVFTVGTPCSNTVPPPPPPPVFPPASGPTVLTTPSLSFAGGASVSVNFSNLPTAPNAWVSIAPAVSRTEVFLTFQYGGGQSSGTLTFAGLSEGQYVARAFADGGYTLVGQSEPFTVASIHGALTVSSAQATYPSGSTLTANFAGSSSPRNWVALARAGAPDNEWVAYFYTDADVNGSRTFSAPPDGNYVFRLFANDAVDKLAESPAFEVGAGQCSAVIARTDKSTYAGGELVLASAEGLPGSQLDWIAVAPQGSSDTTLTQWSYTAGGTGVVRAFFALRGGTYVVRVFSGNGFTKLAQSAPFTVTTSATTPTVASVQASYVSGAEVSADYANLPGNATDWIAVAVAGSSRRDFIRWVYTGGAAAGQANLGTLSNGTYVFRAFVNNSSYLVAESDAFTVSGAAGQGTASTDKTDYAAGESVTVQFDGLPGLATDWVGIYAVGAPNGVFLTFKYVPNVGSGTVTFAGLAAGTYVARTFGNNSFDLVAETAPFTIAP